jgi:anti-anti-sigma factor
MGSSETPKQTAPVEIETHRIEDGVVVLPVNGELDLASVNQLRTALDAALREEAEVVRVDATGVSFLDSSALGVLLAAAKRLAERGGRMELLCVSPSIRRILEMTGISRTVHLVP